MLLILSMGGSVPVRSSPFCGFFRVLERTAATITRPTKTISIEMMTMFILIFCHRSRLRTFIAVPRNRFDSSFMYSTPDNYIFTTFLVQLVESLPAFEELLDILVHCIGNLFDLKLDPLRLVKVPAAQIAVPLQIIIAPRKCGARWKFSYA